MPGKRGTALADGFPAPQAHKRGGKAAGKQKSHTPRRVQQTSRRPATAPAPSYARGGFSCVIYRQVFWLKRQTCFPAFPGISSQWRHGKHSANTATALLGIRTRFPILVPNGTHLYTTLFTLQPYANYYRRPPSCCQEPFRSWRKSPRTRRPAPQGPRPRRGRARVVSPPASSRDRPYRRTWRSLGSGNGCGSPWGYR